MYPLTHLCFANKLWSMMPGLPEDSALIALGCTFPDVVVGGFLDHHRTHRNSGKIVSFFQEHAPELMPFALGMLTHGSDPKGVDWYGDEKYLDFERGYCFEKARPLVQEVIRCCHLPPELGWWKAHNFIEMGIEVDLGERYPQFQRQLFCAYHDQAAIRAVSQVLGKFFERPAREMAKSMTYFTGFVALESITEADLAAKYRYLMWNQHRQTVDAGGVQEAIQHARQLVQDDFAQFESYVLERLVELVNASHR